MEQYQNPVVAEPAKKPVGLQIAALILSIVGFVIALGCYTGSILKNVFNLIVLESGRTVYAQSTLTITLPIVLIALLICLAALILGIVGLVKSIRRATRTVKGIVLSALGVDFAAAGIVLVILFFVMTGIFSMAMQTL